jgi:hypothetical protein
MEEGWPNKGQEWLMDVDNVELAPGEELAYRADHERAGVNAGSVTGGEETVGSAEVVSVAVLGQLAPTGRPGDRYFVLHRMELVRQIEDVTGDAAGVSEVVWGDDEDAH